MIQRMAHKIRMERMKTEVLAETMVDDYLTEKANTHQLPLLLSAEQYTRISLIPNSQINGLD